MKPNRPTYILDSGEERRRNLGLPPRTRRRNTPRPPYRPVMVPLVSVIVGTMLGLAAFFGVYYFLIR
jgi:hypothetical protein